MKCLENAFTFTFEPLTTVFSIILDYCDPSNQIGLWEKNSANFLGDLRTRHTRVPEAVKLLESDAIATEYTINEIQYALTDINKRIRVEDFWLQKNIRKSTSATTAERLLPTDSGTAAKVSRIID